MKYGINIKLVDGSVSTIEEGHKGQKGKAASWPTREAAQTLIDHWTATSGWNHLSDSVKAKYVIVEIQQEETCNANGTTGK